MSRTRVWLISLVLLLAGIGLRLPGLSGYLTPDEHLWAGRTAQFMLALADHDWLATNTSGHPGVTTTWAGSAGLALRQLLARPANSPSLWQAAETLSADPTNIDFLPWLRLPILILGAIGGVLFFLLSRRLMGDAIALLAALFALLDPFWLAHSKIIHLDSLLALSVTLAWLLLMLATQTHRRSLYAASGVAIGLGILTKSPALALGPLILGWLLFDRLSEARRVAGPGSERRWISALGDILLDFLWVGLPAALTCFLLWPALWVAPAESIGRVLGLMQTYSQTGHELGNFWLGEAVSSPGGLFYGAVLLWRTTPLTLIGAVLALAFTVALAWGRSSSANAPALLRSSMNDWRTLIGLWGFVVWYVMIFSLGEKKFDRYLLPIFLVLDLLAAFGWVSLAALWRRRTAPSASASSRFPLPWYGLVGGLLIVQAWLLYSSGPSYLTAYNPLLGGMRTARRVMLVGWGEGLEKAAAFINERSGASGARVSSWYGANVLAPFLDGVSQDVYFETSTPEELYLEDIEYVVTYVNQIQRGLLDAGVAEQLGEPLFVVQHGGVEQAWVYAWPKPYAHTSDRDLSDGWKLTGWEMQPFDPAQGRVNVTLFWDQGALSARHDPNLPVTAWIKDASGEVWATAEDAVTGSERSIPGWSGQPVLAQQLSLHTPLGLPPGPYRVEVAPLDGENASLGEFNARALRMSELAANSLPSVEAQFGDELELVGQEITSAEGETVVDLLWRVRQTPGSAYNTFLHLVDDADAIVAQRDVCLGGPSADGVCRPMTGWAAGDVIRQRLHLTSDEVGQLYVGLYRPETGVRLPLSAGGHIIPDGRFVLPAPDAEGAPSAP